MQILKTSNIKLTSRKLGSLVKLIKNINGSASFKMLMFSKINLNPVETGICIIKIKSTQN